MKSEPISLDRTDVRNRFQILALDGGGLKGLFSAQVLAHLEEDTGARIIDHFDLIAGTSTGGMIALALSIGVRPIDIVDFYSEHGPLIFPQAQLWLATGTWYGGGIEHRGQRKERSS